MNDCNDAGYDKYLKAAGLKRRADLLARELTALFNDAREAGVGVTLEQKPIDYSNGYSSRTDAIQLTSTAATQEVTKGKGKNDEDTVVFKLRPVYVLPINIGI